jgi:predicted metal-binding protein
VGDGNLRRDENYGQDCGGLFQAPVLSADWKEGGEKLKKQTLELIDEAGTHISYERYESVISLARFEYGDRYKRLCEPCPEYGNRFSCPPHSPYFPNYVEGARKARVICVRFDDRLFGDLASDERYLTQFFRRAGKVLVGSLLRSRKKGRVIAGSGPCLLCEQCAAEAGGTQCVKPGGPVYSLESLGVNVADLCRKAFAIDLEWYSEGGLERHVCAVGAVFY